ncbi:MFS transporter [Pengzhenrongella sicca]|uniref:MFS transporter n=1 Tax=Pengzhenrongella sicca TaxID=2819238 RepID=A0A8A4Z8W8_9MICO|nr:MFS transporter [Pengzhenrongella sicca]QTE28294.1 MFS transporter [Pengzhenrongella sicca]
MTGSATRIQRTYLLLMLGTTLAASFIWGINTLFLLDAGLTNGEAFAANAFFTVGMVIFEIPTGVIADAWGRRISFLLGTVTLAATTLAYYVLWQGGAPLWQWAIASILLGLGFTFFSGAVDAWLVDALHFAGYEGSLEAVFGRAQIVAGVATLAGSVAGGYLAQVTNLGVPYLVRTGVLAVMFVVAFVAMHDLGYTRPPRERPLRAVRAILDASLEHGLRRRPVRWLMLASPFISGVSIYAFYAMQPYLLGLYGDEGAYGVAGLAAAIFAGAQVLGGTLAPRVRRLTRRRTSALIAGTAVGAGSLVALGVIDTFWIALALLAVWGIAAAAIMPIHQAYLNDLIPPAQRATVLSFDSLLGSAGGVVIQPVLGRTADVYGYGFSYVVGAGLQLVALPFLWLSRRERSPADIRDAD